MIDTLTAEQTVSIYKFSDGVTLVQDFTNSKTVLKASIDSIELGMASTDLYGAVVTGCAQWTDSYSTSEIEDGLLILFTDGNDTTGSATLEQAKTAIGTKKVITIGVGHDVDPAILEELGTAGYYSVTDFSSLQAEFVQVGQNAAKLADSIYWLYYLSPKRGSNNHDLTLTIKDNLYSGTNSSLTVIFNSGSFYSVSPGVYVNLDSENPNGITSLNMNYSETNTLKATSLYGSVTPSYTWSSSDTDIVSISGSGESVSVKAGVF